MVLSIPDPEWNGDRDRAWIRLGRYCGSTIHSEPLPRFAAFSTFWKHLFSEDHTYSAGGTIPPSGLSERSSQNNSDNNSNGTSSDAAYESSEERHKSVQGTSVFAG